MAAGQSRPRQCHNGPAGRRLPLLARMLLTDAKRLALFPAAPRYAGLHKTALAPLPRYPPTSGARKAPDAAPGALQPEKLLLRIDAPATHPAPDYAAGYEAGFPPRRRRR
jgi:hypothetical protein